MVVLNGGSSSGKTAIARRLQAGLDGTWLVLGVDLFLWTLPSRLFADPAGFDVADGVITRGEEFMRLYGAFQSATATLADSGVDILIDEVLLDGARDQRSWIAALTDLDVCWIAVRCDAGASRKTRAAQRGDRIAGSGARTSGRPSMKACGTTSKSTPVRSTPSSRRESLPTTSAHTGRRSVPRHPTWPSRTH